MPRGQRGVKGAKNVNEGSVSYDFLHIFLMGGYPI